MSQPRRAKVGHGVVAAVLAVVVVFAVAGLLVQAPAASAAGTWTAQASGTSLELTSVSFTDRTHGWAAGAGWDASAGQFVWVVLRTSDGGVTWSTVSSDAAPRTVTQALAIDFTSLDSGWMTGQTYSVDGGGVTSFIRHTSDGGETWEDQAVGLGAELRAVDFGSSSVGCAAGAPGASAGLFVTTDGGSTWVPREVPAPGDPSPSYVGVSAPDRLDAWLAAKASWAMTADGSATWTPGALARTATAVSATSGDVAWLGFGDASSVLDLTTDAGVTWTTVADPPVHASGVTSLKALSATEAWVASREGTTTVSHTVDAGQTWESEEVQSGINTMDFPTADAGWAVGPDGLILAYEPPDLTPPETTALGADDAWHRLPVEIQLRAYDGPDGSGIKRILWSLDGEPPSFILGSSGFVSVGAPSNHSNDGEHVLTYHAVDVAGNVETPGGTKTIKIDTLAPVTTDNAPDGWIDHRFTVQLDAVDTGSGIAEVTSSIDGHDWVRGDTVAIPQGQHFLSYRATDAAGNQEEVRKTQVWVDSVGPRTKALASATVKRGRKVALRYQVNDGVSPEARVYVRITTLTGKVVQKLPTVLRDTNTPTGSSYLCKLPRGRYIFVVEARDLAGNRQTRAGSASLTVR